MVKIVTLRRYTSLTFLILWIAVGITGFMLLIGGLAARLGYRIPSGIVADLHTYIGFTALGVSVIHIALNLDALKSYISKLIRG